MNLEIRFKGQNKGRHYIVVDTDRDKIMFRTFNLKEAEQYIIYNR